MVTGDRRAPDLTSIVDCTSQHRYEVYDVMELPESEELPRVAQERCVRSLLRVTGYDAVKVSGKTAAAVGLIPALRGIEAPRYLVMPRPLLVDDRRQVVCLARMKVPVKAASGGGLLLAVAKTNAFPVVFRDCRSYAADRRAVAEAPCSERHVSERLFTFEADEALGRKFVADVVRDPTPERFDQLDRVCTTALPQVLGKALDKDLRGFASAASRWTDDSTPVRCDVGPREFRTMDLPPGSLVGNQGAALKLMPAPQQAP